MSALHPKSICLVRLSALGDVLMLVPLIRTLQKAFPKTALTWVISRPAFDLVQGLEHIEFIVIDKPNSVKDYYQFRQRMRARHFDVLLAVQSSFRANLLYAFISATRRIGFDPLRAKDGHAWFIRETIQPGHDHTLEGFLRFADVLGVTEHDIRWDLPIAPEDDLWARAHLPKGAGRPMVMLNPAASKSERSWAVDRYIAVLKHAMERWHAQIVLIGGPGADDRAFAEVISAALPVTNLVGQTKPPQLLAAISLADLLLCPDTGPSHMGAAVQTPVIALHAVTSSAVSGPYHYQHWAVDYYPQAVTSILEQSLTQTPWGTHVHGPRTMDLIPVADVMSRLDEVLMGLNF